MSFTEKVLLKSLRFTELSHKTEVLNMATEIMGLSSQIPKPTKKSKPYAGGVVYPSQQEECVCVQHISHPVQWCSQKQRQTVALLAVKILLINIHKSHSCQLVRFCTGVRGLIDA